MAGRITVTVHGVDVVVAMLDRVGNPRWDRLLATLGMTIEEQTVNHFTEQSGPEGPWAPKKRGTGPALIRTGLLRGSISYAVYPDEVRVGTNVFYGKFHQQGTRNMPRRMFLGLTESDKNELERVVEDYIDRLVSRGY